MGLNIINTVFQIHIGETSKQGVEMLLYISKLGMLTLEERNETLGLIQDAEDEDHPDTDWEYLQDEKDKHVFRHFHYLYSSFFISFYSLYEQSLKELSDKISEVTGSEKLNRKNAYADHYITHLENWFDIPKGADYDVLNDFREIRNSIVHNGSDYSYNDREKYIDKYPEFFVKVPEKNTFYILDNIVYDKYLKAINGFFNSFTLKDNIGVHQLT